jgi:pescadillo protein
MLTFLELYQTLLGFVFFKLYTDNSLVYPPPLDLKKYEAAAGVGAFSLQETNCGLNNQSQTLKTVEIDGRKISGKDVRQTIKTISASLKDANMDPPQDTPPTVIEEGLDEDFVPHPSTKPAKTDTLTTLKTLEALPQVFSTALFAPYTFFLSRETPRSIFEFLIRSFGGKVGWPASSGDGSPFDEDDASITHVIIDRPVASSKIESAEEKERRLRRKYVQPQWIVDCTNAGKILLEDYYSQGQTLPPHLSPFGEYEGAYDPTVKRDESQDENEESDAEDAKSKGHTEKDAEEPKNLDVEKALKSAADDPAALRTAELVAEAAGMDYDAFEKEISKLRKKGVKGKQANIGEVEDEDMNKIMMSNKKRKLYEKIKHSQKKKESEVSFYFVSLLVFDQAVLYKRAALEAKKRAILKKGSN